MSPGEVERRASQSERKPRPGDELELVIEAFDDRGQGLSRARDHQFVVRRAVPGERVLVRVLRRRRARVEAVVLARLDPGPHAAEPRCRHFGSCGGCSLQSLAYAEQLAGKRRLVLAALAEHGLSSLEVAPVLGAREPWRYRNKMEFTFASRRFVEAHEPEDAPASFALGLHAAGLHLKVVDVDACPIEHAAADRVLASAREIAVEQGLTPWDLRTHTGLLRHLVIRTALAAPRPPCDPAAAVNECPGPAAASAPRAMEKGPAVAPTTERPGTKPSVSASVETAGPALPLPQILVSLITSADAEPEIGRFAETLLARHPEITTFVHGVNSKPAATAIAERERVLHGPGRLHEQVGGLVFAVSAGSFFQTNTRQAEVLFALVRDEARLSGSETVFDLYCGAGTIALSLASRAREVVGFEQVASSVRDARANAELNRIANVRFVEGDVLASLADPALPRPDLVVVDPPRAGLHPRVVPELARQAPRRMVYVSCNPAALARDLAALAVHGFEPRLVRPVDLFPHTPHVECVVAIERGAPAAPAAYAPTPERGRRS